MLKGLLIGLGIVVIGGYIINEVKKQNEKEDQEFQELCNDIVKAATNAVLKPQDIISKLSEKYN